MKNLGDEPIMKLQDTFCFYRTFSRGRQNNPLTLFSLDTSKPQKEATSIYKIKSLHYIIVAIIV